MKDYCTLFPEGSWTECCAGMIEGTKTRDLIEHKLMSYYSDARRKSNVFVASVIYIGVRAFG